MRDEEATFRFHRIRRLFDATVDLAPQDRLAYLQNACQDAPDLIGEVLALLQAHHKGSSILDLELPDVASQVFAGNDKAFSHEDFRQYRLGAFLGEGGAGTVYLAERRDLKNKVAMKILSSGALSPARRARFMDEQKILAQLDHPSIARIFDADTLSDGTPWFAMEYVEGVPITAFCEARARVTRQRLELFRAVCHAVQYAHSRAVIHLDLKPSNILVKSDGGVKLLDFGIARQLAEEQPDPTRTTPWPMTPAYASPEQLRGEPLGVQTDLYSLGVLLYELLARERPYDLVDKTPMEIERTVVEQTVNAPSTVARRRLAAGAVLPPESLSASSWSDLDVLCLTAMHKDLTQRYSSAEALIRDIDHYLAGEPLEAQPDSLRYRVGKFLRRNRSVVSAAAAVFAVVMVLTVIFVVRLARARNEVLAEVRRTQRIEAFMQNLFDNGDPAAAPSSRLQAVTLIDRGVHGVRTLEGDPSIQAELYQTLGTMYQRLGRLGDASRLLWDSLERRKAINGWDSAQVAQSLVALGLLRLDQGRLDDALRLATDGLVMSKRHLASDDPAVTRSMSALGRILEEKGEYKEARSLLDETVRTQTARENPSADLSASLAQLATAHYYLGNYSEAESLNKRALAMDRQLYGNNHPRVADDLIDLGEIQHDYGNNVTAERYYREALTIKQAWYGTEHPDTAINMCAVGQALLYQSRYDEAAGYLNQGMEIQEKFFGKVHPQVAMCLNALALVDMNLGHLSQAHAEFIRATAMSRSIYGDRHLLVGVALLNLGGVDIRQKNYAGAQESLRAALDILESALPAGHQNIGIGRIKLGQALLLDGRFADAEAYLLTGYKILTKQDNPPLERIAAARKDLVELYTALHKPELAAKYAARSH